MNPHEEQIAELRKTIRNLNDEILALQLAKGLVPDQQIGFSGQPTEETTLTKSEAAQAALGRRIARRLNR